MKVVRSIVQGVRAEMGGRVLYFATTGATLVFLARFLDPGAYGLLFLALAILSVVQLFGDLAIPDSAARYVAEYDELDDERAGAVAVFALLAVMLSATVVSVLLALLHRPIASLFDTPGLGAALLAGGGLVVLRSLYRYFRKILQGFKAIRLSALVYGAEGVGRLVFVVALVGVGYGALGAVGGYTLGFAAAVAVGAVAAYRAVYSDLDLAFGTDADVREQVLGYAVPLIGTRGARIIDARLDTVAVGFFLGPVVVGYYTLSKQAVHLLQAPAASLGFSVGPWFGDQQATGNVGRIAEIYRSSLVYVLLLYIPVSAGLFLLARPTVLVVFGRGYLPAVEVLELLSVLVTLRAVEELTEDALDYLGRARERSIAKGATGAGTIGLIVLLVPVSGVVGVAVAKVLSHVVYVGTLLYIMQIEVGVTYRAVVPDVLSITGITGVMSVAVFLAAGFISGALTLVAVVAIGVGIWAVLSVYAGHLDAGSVASLME